MNAKAALILALTTTTLAAQAQLIDIQDFSGNETVESFDPGFTGQTGTVSYNGFTLEDRGSGTGIQVLRASMDWSEYFTNLPGVSLGRALNDNYGITDLKISLSNPVGRIGVLISTGVCVNYRLTAYDDQNNIVAIGERGMPSAFKGVFIGLESQTNNIAYVTITEPLGENGHKTLIDDIRYEAVPEPATLSLLAAGAIALRARKRKGR